MAAPPHSMPRRTRRGIPPDGPAAPVTTPTQPPPPNHHHPTTTTLLSPHFPDSDGARGEGNHDVCHIPHPTTTTTPLPHTNTTDGDCAGGDVGTRRRRRHPCRLGHLLGLVVDCSGQVVLEWVAWGSWRLDDVIMVTDLLVIVYPWALPRGDQPTDQVPRTLAVHPCLTVFPIFLNWRTLRDHQGAVAVLPPPGHLAYTELPPVVQGDVLRVDVHTIPEQDLYRANVLWLSMPSFARSTPVVPSPHVLTVYQEAITSCGIHVMSVERADGAMDILHGPRTRRKGVPYRFGASGRASRSAAMTPLEPGVWACRVGSGYSVDLNEGATGEAVFVPFTTSSMTSTVSMSRRGHRRAAEDRVIDAVRDSLAAYYEVERPRTN